ncbi:MAG: hypothetical protein AAFY88_07730 [Acidobacteriota bacterium]
MLFLLRPASFIALLAASLLAAACTSVAPAPPAAEPASGSPASGSPASGSPASGSPSAEDAPSSPADESEEEHTNKIRWTTASEVENFGFDVYRGDSEDGPFELLTEQPLEGGGTVDEPRSYVFVDDTIDPTRAYYYYVESITMDGVRERFTPVVRAKPKKPASEP